MPSEIERVALIFPDVLRARAVGVDNPITGQHIEVTCQSKNGLVLDRNALRRHFRAHLPRDIQPHRIKIGPVVVSHRFKQL